TTRIVLPYTTLFRSTLNHFERQPFYKKFGWTQEIAYSGSNASNTYNALQVQADKRFSSGYEFQAHYTWSKALGYNNDYFAIDPRSEEHTSELQSRVD